MPYNDNSCKPDWRKLSVAIKCPDLLGSLRSQSGHCSAAVKKIQPAVVVSLWD